MSTVVEYIHTRERRSPSSFSLCSIVSHVLYAYSNNSFILLFLFLFFSFLFTFFFFKTPFFFFF